MQEQKRQTDGETDRQKCHGKIVRCILQSYGKKSGETHKFRSFRSVGCRFHAGCSNANSLLSISPVRYPLYVARKLENDRRMLRIFRDRLQLQFLSIYGRKFSSITEECRLSFMKFISKKSNSKSTMLSLKLYQTKSVSRISTRITERMDKFGTMT